MPLSTSSRNGPMKHSLCSRMDEDDSPRYSMGTFRPSPVAQLDRASASGAEDRTFESCRAHHTIIRNV